MLDIRVKRAARALRLLALVVGGAGMVAGAARAEVPKKLLDGLHADSPKVRIIAVYGVGKLKDPQARTLLEPMLKDADPTVRAAAIESLGRVADPASLPAIEPLLKDDDETVKAMATRTVPQLQALVMLVDVGEVNDYTEQKFPGLLAMLQDQVAAEVQKALGPTVSVKKGGVDKGFGLLLALRSIKRTKDQGNTIVEVRCDLTLVEMPGKILRLTTAATAGAGVAGDAPKSMDAELAKDGVGACAPSLAADFVEYAKQRRGR